MPTKSYLTDNNDMLDNSNALLLKKLSNKGFHIVEHSSENPFANIWSMTVSDKNCSLLRAIGNGTSKESALQNALKTFIEHLSTHYFWSDYYLGGEISHSKYVHSPKEQWFETNTNDEWPDLVLDNKLRDFYNPIGELKASNLIDINSSNKERGICCCPFENILANEVIHFPINLVSTLYANNGIASGSTITEARVNSLCEILERFIQFKVIAEGFSLPKIPDNILNQYPNIQTYIKSIEALGYSIFVQDASLNGHYPVLAVTLLNPKNQHITVSFGAHPKFEIALVHCFTSLLQTNNSNEAGFDMDEIASPQNLEAHVADSNAIIAWKSLNDTPDFEFVNWNKKYSDIDSEEEFKQLCSLMHEDGNEIYIADHTDENLETDVHVCQILVPGLSEIYPIDDLVWENNNIGIDIRVQILKKNKTLEDCENLIEDLEGLNQDDNYLISKLIAQAPDTDSIYFDLSVAELILLLALKTQDNERIQENCEWLLDFKNIKPKRLKTYQCINTILQLDQMTNYGTALENLYTRDILNDALALIDGEDVFSLESDWEMHNSLIEAYKKSK